MFRFADVPLSLSGMTRIAGKRVFLRAPTMDDWAEWAELRARSRAFLTPWEPTWPDDSLSRDHYRRRLRQQVREWRAGEAYGLFIFLNDRRRLVGGINLSNVRRGVAQTASVGYWMGQPFAGQGLMTIDRDAPVALPERGGIIGDYDRGKALALLREYHQAK